jgi:hypothetical protein
MGSDESGNVADECDMRRSRCTAGGAIGGGKDCGSAATTMSEAPEKYTRGICRSSRQPLSNMSATVQFMLRLGGVPTGSANAVVSRRHARAGSIESAPFSSNDGGNEYERRNVSMLSKRRFATELRGRGGSRCTRWALIGGVCDPVDRLLSVSSESWGVGAIE